MRHQALFDHVMTSGLRDWLDSQATAREEAKRQNLQTLTIGMGIAVAVAIAVMAFMPSEPQNGLVAGALIGGITWWIANLPVQAITQQIKVRANEELGAALGLTYHPKGTPGSDFDLATRLGRARITLDMPDQVRAGMFAEADILVASRSAIAVPVTAVGSEGKETTVMTVKDGVVHRTVITTGIRDGGWVEVVSGLAEGDQIVAKAGAFVTDGDKINPISAATN